MSWGNKKLGDVLDFFNGKGISDREGGEYLVYGANGTIGFSQDYRHENAIILGRVGAYCGAVMYEPKKFWASDNTIVVKPKIDGTEKFYYYLLKYLELNKYAGGAAQPLITQTIIKQIKAKLPEAIEHQRKISSILSAYDDLIENNTRRIKILEEMAQAIYKEWFVNFRFPGHEKVKFVESELGKIPEGWEVKKLEEILELKYGKGLKKDKRSKGKYPVFGSGGIVDNHISYLVEGPGIIVGRKGNVGSVFLSINNFFPIDTVFYVNSKLSPYYNYYLLKAQSFINTDAAVPGLNRAAALSKKIVFPTIHLIEKFADYLQEFYLEIDLLEIKNSNLRKTRDLLLPKLMSGEIDVEEMDIPINND